MVSVGPLLEFSYVADQQHQQKKPLLHTDRARGRTACVRPIRSVCPKRPPLRPVRPVRPERPERPGVLGLHLLRLVPPNTLVPVLTTRRTCHGLIPSKHPPSVSSRLGVSRVDLPDSGSRTAWIRPGTPHNACNTLPTLYVDSSPRPHPAGALHGLLPSSAPCRSHYADAYLRPLSPSRFLA